MAGQLAAALALARRGFRVFPLRPYGKKPAIDAFPVAATTDEATLLRWWTMDLGQVPEDHPEYGLALAPLVNGERECNVGVCTTDLVVMDIDVKKGPYATGNYETLGGHYDTFIVRTPTGGFHCYFDGPDSKLAVDIVPGVDVRSHNGYVVGPGSYLDPQYTNEPDVRVQGWYTVQHDAPMAWVPTSIELQLEKPGRRERINVGVELDTETAQANAAVWLEKLDPAIEGQGGDNHTYNVACSLVRDYALSADVAWRLMLEHWNERCQPPWVPEELYKKVLNASEYGQGALGAALPEYTFGAVQVPEPPKVNGHAVLPSREYDGSLLDVLAIPPRPWLVERLLMRGDVTVMAAPGSGGKSAITLTVVCHWAVGKDFGPYKLKVPNVPIKVFVYNAEDDKSEQSRRVAAICMAYGLDYAQVRANILALDDSVGELCLCVSVARALTVNKDAVEWITSTIKDFGADVAVFDPLVNMHGCNENDNSEMRFVVSLFRKLARETNTAVFLAHHTSKGAGKGHRGDSEGIRGAGAIVNSARIAVMLSSPDDDDCEVYGIRDFEKRHYVRIDDAKANMYLSTKGALMWLRWQSVALPNGDHVGVAVMQDMNNRANDERGRVVTVCYERLIANGRGAMTRADMVRALQQHDPLYAKMAEATLRGKLDKYLATPVQFGNHTLVMKTVEKDLLVMLE